MIHGLTVPAHADTADDAYLAADPFSKTGDRAVGINLGQQDFTIHVKRPGS